jgi:hypothetical protein
MELFLILLLSIGVLLLLTPFLIYRPWESIIFFGLFLLFQDYLHAVISYPVAKQVIKNADEFFIWYFFLLSVIVAKNKKFILFDYLVIGMLLAGLVSSYINAVKPIIIVSDIILMFKFYALFRAITLREFNTKNIESYIRLVFLAALGLFAFGLMEVIAPTQVKSMLWGRAISEVTIDERFGITSASGLFIHPGFYGTFMAFVAALAISRYLILFQKKYLFLFAIFILGILLSMRRKALFGIIFAIIIFLFLNYQSLASIRRRVIISFVAFMILFGIVFQNQLQEMVQSTVENYFSSETIETSARDVMYFVSAEIAVDRFPFGVGLGRFGGFISMKYYSDVYYDYGINNVYGLSGNENEVSFGTDTFWPYILGELGVIGFFLFCILIYKLLQSCLRFLRQETDLLEKSFTIGAYLILLESTFEAFASPIYANSMTIYFVFVPLGLVYSFRRAKSGTWNALPPSITTSHA